MTYRTIVLDLDNCPIFAPTVSQNDLAKCDLSKGFLIYHLKGQMICYVQKRRGFDHFVRTLLDRGKRLVVWSSGPEQYVKTVCNLAFGPNDLAYILTNQHLDPLKRGKDIRLLANFLPDFNLEETVLIDDNPDNAIPNPKNYIGVASFFGEHDDELERVLALPRLQETMPTEPVPTTTSATDPKLLEKQRNLFRNDPLYDPRASYS